MRPAGQGVVIAVAHAADRRLDAGLRETLGVVDGNVLAAPVAVMNEAAAMQRAPLVQGLFQRIQNEACLRRPRHAPADDPPRIGVDDEAT